MYVITKLCCVKKQVEDWYNKTSGVFYIILFGSGPLNFIEN